jgi:L-alanine-DL-glutamate epimerase-like enolase superfamily enzyme
LYHETKYENSGRSRHHGDGAAGSPLAPRQWLPLGRFVRTIVEVETDTGLIGLGEMGGGGESAEAVFRAMKSYLLGHDPPASRKCAS